MTVTCACLPVLYLLAKQLKKWTDFHRIWGIPICRLWIKEHFNGSGIWGYQSVGSVSTLQLHGFT